MVSRVSLPLDVAMSHGDRKKKDEIGERQIDNPSFWLADHEITSAGTNASSAPAVQVRQAQADPRHRIPNGVVPSRIVEIEIEIEQESCWTRPAFAEDQMHLT